MKAYRMEALGELVICFAESRGRARYLVAKGIFEAGFKRRLGGAFKEIRCVRAPEYDMEAVGRGEGYRGLAQSLGVRQ